MIRSRILILLSLCVLVALPVLAQRIDGDLRGEVKDQTGALIPGAKVIVTNEATGLVRSVETTDVGIFFVGNLLPGTYTVEVTSEGFRHHRRKGVEVIANRISEVQIALELGEIASTVEVVAGAEVVQTTTTTLAGGTFKKELTGAVANVALDGDPINLAITAPGTTTQSGGVAGTGGAIGGNRPRQNNFVVDGLDNNDPSVTGPLTDVIADAVEEFTLLTNQFTAEYGHSTAGQFITTMKSGTNEYHGAGWLYVQNRNLNALDNLTRANTAPGDPKPKFDWQRFGGQGGGPILKDRWFIWGAYERQEYDVGSTPSGTIYVPTAAGRTALQNLAASATSGVSPTNVGIILDNAPTAPTADALVSASNLVCDMGAVPTGMSCTSPGPWQVPVEMGAFSASVPNFSREHRFYISSDATLGAHRLSARFHYQRYRSEAAGELPVSQFNSEVVFDPRRFTFSDVWTVTPHILNEFRLAFVHDINGYFLPRLPAAPGSTDVFGNYNMPDINLFIGPSSNLPQGGLDNVYQATNNTTWVRGSHTFKGGVEFRKIISASDFLPRARGEYEWVADPNLQLSDMDAFVHDFFPSSVSIRGVGLSKFSQNRAAIYWFLQDSWKIHPRVTLELGLRYEFTQTARDTVFQNLNGLSNIADLTSEMWTLDLVNACAFAQVPVLDSMGNQIDTDIYGCVVPYDTPTSLNAMLGSTIFSTLPQRHQDALLAHVGNQLIFTQTKPDRNNWAPRIGLAWDVFGDGKTSVRAGFAVAHDIVFGNLPLLQLPPQMQAENRETNACSLSPAPAWCGFVTGGDPLASPAINYLNTGFVEGGALFSVLPGDAGNDRVLARILTGGFTRPQEITPETYTWSLALQREIWRKLVVETRYVGTRGVHLPIQRWMSAGIPNPYRVPTFASQSEIPASFAGQPTLADWNNNRDLLLWPFGFQGVITTFSPDGTSNYHGASVSLRGNIGWGLFLDTNYTWSKTIDLIENELFTSFMNPRRPWDMINIHESRGLSGLHHPHKFVVSWNWDVPGYKGDTGFFQKLTQGWIFQGAFIAESGQPLTPLSRRDTNGDFDTAGDRAFYNPAGVGVTSTDVTAVCWNGTTVSVGGCGSSQTVGYVVNDPNAAYVRPGTGAYAAGSLIQLGRGTLESPGMSVFNFSFIKDTPVWGEQYKVRFQADFINAFNHPSFTIGNGSVYGFNGNATNFPNYVTPGTSDFLDKKIFSGGLGQSPFQRVIQFSLKVIF